MPESSSSASAVSAPADKKPSHPRLHFRLQARMLERLPPGCHIDGDGLMLRVTRNGSRSWILRTIVHGVRRDIGLGSLQLVTLSQARDLARELRGNARRGEDPRTVLKKRHARVMPFREAAVIVHAQHEKSWKNRKHAKQWINTLEQYVFPTLGDTPVDRVHSEDIVKALSPIWLLKPETARRVIQRIGTVLLWAKGTGLRADSPSDEVQSARRALPKQHDQARHHKALPYSEVEAFVRRLRQCSAAPAVKLALEFLILTASRTNEVLGAAWTEFDLEERVWTIPESRMKAKREHRVPLTDRCAQILLEARGLCQDRKGYVFPGAKQGAPLSNMALLMLLRRMEVPITAHGFRSTFRVWCAERASFTREVAEAALAHSIKDATEAAYMRSDFFEKRRALMSAWSDFVSPKAQR